MVVTWIKSGSRATLIGMRDTRTGELCPLTVRDIVEFQGAFQWGKGDAREFEVITGTEGSEHG